MLLPVIAMTLFVVILLTMLFSRAYIDMILQQENETNAAGFDMVSHSITSLIDTSINDVRRIMADDRIVSYARLQYASQAELVHARFACRDYLQREITRHDGIFGLLLMRKDGSLFGVLPEGSFFLDEPEKNPLPADMKAQILSAPLGQTVWVGPLAGSAIYGFENSKTPRSIMIAAWKSVNVNYGECYVMMLMDESIFEDQFAALRDGQSSWHLFTEDRTEIYHTGQDTCQNPERLISESNSGNVFYNENDQPICAFSMTMDSPAWTIIREISMENYEQVVQRVRRSIILIGGAVFLIGLTIYWLWMKRRVPQFDSLLDGIIRMGEGEAHIVTSQRSATASARRMMGAKVAAHFLLAGAEVEHASEYPGWKPNLHSRILEVSVASYRALFRTEPEVKAIHAGLECGLFGEKFGDLDMISFGPTLRGVHTPGERLDLASLEKFTRHLADVVIRFQQ